MQVLLDPGELDAVPDDPEVVPIDPDRIPVDRLKDALGSSTTPLVRRFVANQLDRTEEVGRVPPVTADEPSSVIVYCLRDGRQSKAGGVRDQDRLGGGLRDGNEDLPLRRQVFRGGFQDEIGVGHARL